MKWCVLVIISLLKLTTQQSDDDTETIVSNKFREVCIKESNVDPSLLSDETALSSDKNLMCFIKCVMMKSGVIDENGDLMIASIMEVFQVSDADPFTAKIKKCQEIKVDDPCESAYKKHNCVMETD